MTARNDITGDLIASKGSNDAYRDGWDRIFGKSKIQEILAPEPTAEELQQRARDELTHQWWAYCEKHQRTLERIPTFEEWKVAQGL